MIDVDIKFQYPFTTSPTLHDQTVLIKWLCILNCDKLKSLSDITSRPFGYHVTSLRIFDQYDLIWRVPNGLFLNMWAYIGHFHKITNFLHDLSDFRSFNFSNTCFYLPARRSEIFSYFWRIWWPIYI